MSENLVKFLARFVFWMTTGNVWKFCVCGPIIINFILFYGGQILGNVALSWFAIDFLLFFMGILLILFLVAEHPKVKAELTALVRNSFQNQTEKI